MGNFFSQSFFIPNPTITEHTCPDQKGRVLIVTGGYAGVGYEVTRLLFIRNATVYIAGRSESKAATAISKLKSEVKSSGRLEFLFLDLADLKTIKPAVESFTAKASRLDVLLNNAGVMYPPVGSTSAQGYEMHIGTNCLGPYLLYKLLLPLLSRTAASSPTASVRVAWAGSLAIEVVSPQPGGMKLHADGSPDTESVSNEVKYAQSKVANLYFARELAPSTSSTKVVHTCFNPGNLRTQLQRHWKGMDAKAADFLLFYPAPKGGCTELWAAVAPEIIPEKSGSYVWPWGRFGRVRDDVEAAMKSEAEGGTGLSKRFVAWCDQEIAPFA